jgi:hypothetical protein
MVREAPISYGTQLAERVPTETGVEPSDFPDEIIAEEWLDKFSEELTWADMVRWLGESG